MTLAQALRETEAPLSDGPFDSEDVSTDYRAYLVARKGRVSEFRSQRLSGQATWPPYELSSATFVAIALS